MHPPFHPPNYHLLLQLCHSLPAHLVATSTGQRIAMHTTIGVSVHAAGDYGDTDTNTTRIFKILRR